MKKSFLGSALALMLTFGIAPIGSADAAAKGVLATFEGQTIDLSKGWGDAKACITDGTTTQCFRSETEMQSAPSTQIATLATGCIPSVMLYSGTYFTGLALNLTASNSVIALSGYGFDNITSSYGIGYCNASFYDGLNKSTAQYPGPTNAYASATVMMSGWDNRISSVFIAP
jgi:hypothetical protein